MDTYNKYKHLNESERTFIKKHSVSAENFSSNADTALEEAQKRFSPATLHNGSGDAFRHCFWSAMNARDQGKDLAKMFGDAHEDFDGNPVDEKAMDLHNNEIGYEIGSSCTAGSFDRHLAILCVQAWTDGKLVQMKSASETDLIYSNTTDTYDGNVKFNSNQFTTGPGVDAGLPKRAAAATASSSVGPSKRTHTVQAGDSLWKISQHFFGNGALFKKLINANPGKLKDEHSVIHPGDKLNIPD
jgi:nucleoid-associated protein YgaU